MARITKINTNIARKVLHSLVAKNEGKYKNTGVSKTTFKKDILERATGSGIQALRGGAKNIDRNTFRRSVKDLADYFKAHPEKYTVKKGTAEEMGARVYEGSKLKEGYDNPEFLKKADRYAVGIQTEEDKSKVTGPSPKEELRMERRNAVMKNLNIRSAITDRENAEKGLAGPPTSLSEMQKTKSATSATSHENIQGTIAGKSQVAGQNQNTPVPGQLSGSQPAKPAGPSSSPVHLAGLSGLGKLTNPNRPASQDEAPTVPVIGISEENNNTKGQDTGKIIDLTSKMKAEKAQDTDKQNEEDNDLPNMDDVDKGLPLAA